MASLQTFKANALGANQNRQLPVAATGWSHFVRYHFPLTPPPFCDWRVVHWLYGD
ncbi:hypothetical protein T11_14748 [Trichinella zimbabwensis]|uniref:Uncharacterized protein n=1 Tax=Trichinella zimbabwensis TaxID=268475 RepID=A0A0V1G8Q4_9BILA|nr:hypothetical protein T11_14748 [Trichinella zimbabwensis]